MAIVAQEVTAASFEAQAPVPDPSLYLPKALRTSPAKSPALNVGPLSDLATDVYLLWLLLARIFRRFLFPA